MQLRQILKRSQEITATFRMFASRADTDTFAGKKALYGSLFPDKLLSKKAKAPQSMYIANEEGAQMIMKALEPHLTNVKYNTVLEMNPGIGVLTRLLLDRQDIFQKFLLVESNEYFMNGLMELLPIYEDQVSLTYGDLACIWKLAYQDKMDHGTRVEELLAEVPRRAYDDEPNVMIVGAIGSYNFFSHLISSLIFQNSLFSYGRPELFLIISPLQYIHLTCSREVGYMLYRSSTMLFQMLFEYRFITKVPREYFLPTQFESSTAKSKKLAHITDIDRGYLYLVKVVPRRNLHELCAVADLPALSYFTVQNCISRRNRVIPNMEKWVPGCGPRLILNKEPSEAILPLYPDDDLQQLPTFCTPCTTMSCKNYFPNINIFTQFGDLNASQMLTLFTQFRSWPEYAEGSFLASLESNLLKMETSEDDSIEKIAEEDEAAPATEVQNNPEQENPAGTTDSTGNKEKNKGKKREKKARKDAPESKGINKPTAAAQ